MIVDLLRYPVRVVSTALKAEFSSVFSQGGKAFSGASRDVRSYRATTRGILIAKDALTEGAPDLSKGYTFQFNPNVLSDVKNTEYEVRSYPGLAYNDYIWSGGGERNISFKLFLDDTPQSHTKEFNPKIPANEIVNDARARSNRNAPENFTFTDTAYSNSRIHERGVLPITELLQSYLYPAPLKGETTPKFSEGGVVNNWQFRPPQIVVFCFGPMYLEGVVRNASVEYSLFDQDLTPIRASVDVEISIMEFTNLERLLP